MRRTLAQRQQHIDFAVEALRVGQGPSQVVALLQQTHQLTPRQARCDLDVATSEIREEGTAVRTGHKQAEDLCLALRRIDRAYREALDRGDLRTALKAEKARCRLQGLYTRQRCTPQELAAAQAEADRDHADHEQLAFSRRRLRKVARADHVRTAALQCHDAPGPNGEPNSPACIDYDIASGMAPPTNAEHKSDCPCWKCNPLHAEEHEVHRRRDFPDWLRRQQRIRADLAKSSPRWLPRPDRVDKETDEQFRDRVRRLAAEHRLRRENGLAAGPPQSPVVEQRLAVLTKWLELGISRATCRARYQQRYELSPRKLRAEWDLCLARFNVEGRYLIRRANADLALGLAFRRRELLSERGWQAGDYKLALDIEIDRTRLAGLDPADRKHLPPLPDLPAEIAARDRQQLLDHLDPAGRGTGLPTPAELSLIAALH